MPDRLARLPVVSGDIVCSESNLLQPTASEIENACPSHTEGVELVRHAQQRLSWQPLGLRRAIELGHARALRGCEIDGREESGRVPSSAVDARPSTGLRIASGGRVPEHVP